MTSSDDSITTGNISGTGIAIGHGASVTIINQIVHGPDELPTRYDGLIQSFLEYYLGTKEGPAPFGGRAQDLDALDAWLNDPSAPPYAALIAPAGRGKSALLAHWITRLMADKAHAPHIVYFPISIRFGTNLETVAFASLAARMAHLYSEKVTQALDVQQYRGVFADYMRRAPSDGRPVLVVIDGLDEAAGWDIGAGLFPITPTSHLRVLIAARPLAGDADERTWLSRLGWDVACLAKPLALGGLDRAGVADVLQQMGNPLDKLATKIDVVVTRLYELSEGDPLMVSLYIKALLSDEAQPAMLTVERLQDLRPGLKPLVDLWIEEQRKLWDGRDEFAETATDAFIKLCALAYGPLTSNDMRALVKDVFSSRALVKKTARTIRRFIVGNGDEKGYVFSHSRLREYFWDDRFFDSEERQEWQKRFLAYGKETLTALRDGSLAPCDAPAYVVRHYGAHLTKDNASDEDVYTLMCEPWLHAWEELSGTPSGFLTDVDRAWRRAEAVGYSDLGKQVLAALCKSSVFTISTSVTPVLLFACVKHGVIGPSLGLVMARQKPEPKDRAECLLAIADHLPQDRESIMREALDAAHAIHNESRRMQVLEKLAECLSEPEREQVLKEIQTISDASGPEMTLNELMNWQSAVQTLIRVYQAVIEQRQTRLTQQELNEAWDAARFFWASNNKSGIALLLGPLTRLLAEPDRAQFFAEMSRAESDTLEESDPQDILKELLSMETLFQKGIALSSVARNPRTADKLTIEDAIDAVGEFPNGFLEKRKYVKTLKGLISILPEPGLPKDKLLATAQAIKDEKYRADVLVVLAKELPKPDLIDVFNAACAIESEDDRAEVLVVLADRAPESQLDTLLAATRVIKEEASRAWVLWRLADRLPKARRRRMLYEALRVARTIENAKSRAWALTRLSVRFSKSDRARVLAEALTAARVIRDPEDRTEALANLAEQLPEEDRAPVLAEALDAARAIHKDEDRVEVVVNLAEQLPEADRVSVLKEALQVSRAIHDEKERSEALIGLAEQMSDPDRTQILMTALDIAHAIKDESRRRKFLDTLAERAPESIFNALLAEVRTLKNAWHRAESLIALSRHSSQADREGILREALNAAQNSESDTCLPLILVDLAEQLPDSMLPEALDAVEAIEYDGDRAKALIALIKRMPESLLVETLDEADAIEDEEHRADVLVALAKQLPASLLDKALPIALNIKDNKASLEVLAVLATRLPEPECTFVSTKALLALQRIKGRSSRAKALLFLAKRLSEPFLYEVLVAAYAVKDDEARARVFVALVERLPESLLYEILLAAPAIKSESERAKVLLALIQRLPELMLGEALLAARALTVSIDRAAVFAALADKWPAPDRALLFEEVLNTIRAIEKDYDRAVAISEVANQLPEQARMQIFSEMLTAIRTIPSEHSPEKVLFHLTIRGLPEALMNEALDVAGTLTYMGERAWVLELALIEQLPETLISKALRLLWPLDDSGIRHASDCSRALGSLVLRWNELRQLEHTPEFGDVAGTLRAFSRTPRQVILDVIRVLAPVLLHYGGEQAIRETAQAIIDTAKWWP